jgi:small neutral amino acid transporter SnatA (MarC family)
VRWGPPAAVAIGLLLMFAFFVASGEFIGISCCAFRIAGGVLLFITALDMLFPGGVRRGVRLKYG